MILNLITIVGMISSIKNFDIIRKSISGKIEDYKILSKKLAKEITQGNGQKIMTEFKNSSSD